MRPGDQRLRRQYAKFCDVRDWEDPDVLRALRDILPERDPESHMERKVWEFAMLALALEDLGRLDDRAEALAIGAGDERMVFWLANRIGRVVATDIYGEGAFAHREAVDTMLTDPATHAPFPYREDRLEVIWMDACDLSFPDASFDVAFSLSSIEHFGGPAEIARSAREMGRVLRPGGHAIVVADCFIRLDPRDAVRRATADRLLGLLHRLRPSTRAPRRSSLGETLTARELESLVIRPSGLRPLQTLDQEVSPASFDNVTRSAPGGGLAPATGEYWPHIVLQTRRSPYTSACLVLEKPGQG